MYSTRIFEKARGFPGLYTDPYPRKIVLQVHRSTPSASDESPPLTEALAPLERPAHLEVRWECVEFVEFQCILLVLYWVFIGW